MLKPVKIPRCVANIFSIGNSTDINIIENFEYRPDKIQETLNAPSMNKELIDNYMSNISPITLRKGSTYTITDNMFKGYFGNV
jgi:hypothetical protein